MKVPSAVFVVVFIVGFIGMMLDRIMVFLQRLVSFDTAPARRDSFETADHFAVCHLDLDRPGIFRTRNKRAKLWRRRIGDVEHAPATMPKMRKIKIPAAIEFLHREFKGGPAVQVVIADGLDLMREVTLGQTFENAIEVLDGLKEKLNAAGASRFGSGWAWLVVTKEGKLVVTSTPNQDNPLMDSDVTILLGIDVWEHAYYKKYGPNREKYIKQFLKIVNWDYCNLQLEQ